MLNKGKPNRKRAPLTQLREAASKAHELLSNKNVVHKDNVLERLAKEAGAPILPGLPSYLPHRWTIEAAQRAMHAIIVEWMVVTEKDLNKQDNAAEFFKFVVKVMKVEEKKYKREMKITQKEIKGMKEVRLLSEIFSPHRRWQTTRALHKFFIDSFAVSLIVKQNDSTSSYADWFLNEWTPSLYKLWTRHANTHP